MLGIFDGRSDFVRLLGKAMTNHVIAVSIEMLGVGSIVTEEVFPTASHAVDHDERLPIFRTHVDVTRPHSSLNISLTQCHFPQLTPNTSGILGHVRQPSFTSVERN